MVNINPDEVEAQKKEKENASKKGQEKKIKFGNFEFDEKHYLNTRLSKTESSREIVIRLLPFSETELSPFKKIHVHSIRVMNEKGELQWKKFMCPIGMEKSDKCPMCETEKEAWKLMNETTDDEAKKTKYKERALAMKSKDYWLVRCIDRANEEDGVKFWRFPDARNGDGIWDKIYALFNTKQKRGVNIFDLYEGKDLIITVTKQTDSAGKEKLVYQIQDDEEKKPLSPDETTMEKWVYDPMKWDDVYSVKDYEYLSIVVAGDYPVWNKELGKWIGRKDAEAIENEAKVQEEIENAQEKTNDFSSFTVNIKEDKYDNLGY